ncbi:hypothetical protein K461DRAFT_275749 [Myriangium duriaei CBS 260.36]|uniref:Telomere length regulation protein conserved domain-containing protein n=1 Tax=Myriangium duriaei CBS 260.36 TaxID=1168546 RepID=A0A9P4MHD0_9PEZI|nr:hypothetical protein K461DRAFT_275749 [Myriangium duriaei CBS 260.36]
MSDLFQVISTISLDHGEQPPLSERTAHRTSSPRGDPDRILSTIKGPEDVLTNLKSQPTEEDAKIQLQWLLSNKNADFDIHFPNAQSISILRAIIDLTVPDLWRSSRKTQGLLIQCLSSFPGISALVSKLGRVTDSAANRSTLSIANGSVPGDHHLALLQRILSQRSLLSIIWHGLRRHGSDSQRKLIWKDLTNLICSGKIVSTVARFKDTSGSCVESWIVSGQRYAPLLASWALRLSGDFESDDDASWDTAAVVLSKSFGLGYPDVLAKSLCLECLETGPKCVEILGQVVKRLRPLDQKRFLGHLLPVLQNALPSSNQESLCIGHFSAFISKLSMDNDVFRKGVVSWIQTLQSASTISQIGRRAVIAAISNSLEDLTTVLDCSLQAFGETLFIKHAPAVEQEACAEVILLSAGHLKQRDPNALIALARSSIHMSGVSNRLDASSQRARVLGMCVGMAISRLTDKSTSKMDFGVEDVKTTYARQLMDLVEVRDSVGSLENVKSAMRIKDGSGRLVNESTPSEQALKKSSPKPGAKVTPAPTAIQSSGPRIIEVLSDDEDDDLVPYAKPDSDPEDDDEDPTLVNRDKAKAPVYIRDLMNGLREDENYDRHKLSLEHAAPLIRRKAQFGQEVKDHAIELSMILIGLQDTFELEDFIQLRLQALIALLISDPSELGPFYARQVFEGDYSISQRGTLLSAIGLSARELAGYQDADALNPSVIDKASFPSKRLPDRYHAIYDPSPTQPLLPSSPLNTISASLTDTIIAPLAAQAADTATGPSALKVRTFSSRLTNPPSARTKIIPNALAAVLADSFFTPLAGGFHTHTRTGANNVFASPFFLGTYLTTLAVLLHASGPATRSLPQLTADFWALLLAARRSAREDSAVLKALLFGLLTILEVNQDDTRRVAMEHGRELVETREWVGDVYGRMAGGDEEGDRLRGLAAGVLVKCGEVMEKWERLLVGEMMDY